MEAAPHRPTVPNLVWVHSRANEVSRAGFRTNSEEHAAVDLHQDADQNCQADEGQIEHHVANPDRLQDLPEQAQRRVAVDDVTCSWVGAVGELWASILISPAPGTIAHDTRYVRCSPFCRGNAFSCDDASAQAGLSAAAALTTRVAAPACALPATGRRR